MGYSPMSGARKQDATTVIEALLALIHKKNGIHFGRRSAHILLLLSSVLPNVSFSVSARVTQR
jgi:hypothetical protein